MLWNKTSINKIKIKIETGIFLRNLFELEKVELYFLPGLHSDSTKLQTFPALYVPDVSVSVPGLMCW